MSYSTGILVNFITEKSSKCKPNEGTGGGCFIWVMESFARLTLWQSSTHYISISFINHVPFNKVESFILPDINSLCLFFGNNPKLQKKQQCKQHKLTDKHRMPFHLNLMNKSCVQTPFNQHCEGSTVCIAVLSSCLHTVCEAAGTETLESARITASHMKANMVLYQVERKTNHK